ncbi:hypothetical protein [Pseudoalteromonas sp. S16_S37]|nr:hypothetical protein [Pseudoalteromonas sp. S16_S37]MBD1584931.1 hypothetical protein [Pseudoalteromonas sp. S16_S37]
MTIKDQVTPKKQQNSPKYVGKQGTRTIYLMSMEQLKALANQGDRS